MNKTTDNRFGGIDLFKHILAIFVIWHHIRSESRYSNETNMFIENITFYINGAVIGFFIISGFFFRYHESLSKSVYRIFKRTMIPFFIFSILYSFLLSFLGKDTLLNGLYNTLILKGAAMHLYYLPFLFLIYSFYLVVHKFFSKNNYRIVLINILILLSIISLFLPTQFATGSNYSLLSIYALSFGICIYLSAIKKESNRKFLLNVSIIITICLFVGLLDFRFIHVAIMLLLLILFLNISKRIKKQLPGSGGVYLLHTPIVNSVLSILFVSLGIIEMENLFLTLITTYVLTLLITLVFIKLFPKQRYLLLE